LNIDGNLSSVNIPYLINLNEALNAFISDKPVPVLTASFGCTLFSRVAISAIGYPKREFFIWGDDVEYTIRMLRHNFKRILDNQKYCKAFRYK